MSYEFSLDINVGGKKPKALDGYYLNYTYNAAAIFQKALMTPRGIHVIDGVQAGFCVELFREGIKQMKLDRRAYEALSPKNSWEDAEGALTVLRTLYRWSREAPLATFRIT